MALKPWREIATVNWLLPVDDEGKPDPQILEVAAMLGIYAELRSLNQLLHCTNFLTLPQEIRGIRHNTTKPKKKKLIKKVAA